MLPRVKTFAWRLLRRAIPSGTRVARLSRHIDGLCARCGLSESDVHTFFLCPFARAAWFLDPWHLRVDILSENYPSFAQALKKILAIDHPHMNLGNLLTFMWCIWKARNEYLFRRKESQPYPVGIAAKALLLDLESRQPHNSVRNRDTVSSSVSRLSVLPSVCRASRSVETLSIPNDTTISGHKTYTDAAWKPGRNSATTTAGLGVYLHLQEPGVATDVSSSRSPQRSWQKPWPFWLLLAAALVSRLQKSQWSCP